MSLSSPSVSDHLLNLASRDSAALVASLANRWRGQIAAVSSFGADAAVLLHLVMQADPDLPVLFLDTGKHFPATLRHRDALTRHLGLRDVRSLVPNADLLARRDPRGALWSADPEACCALRKVDPLEAALADYPVWFTGRRRDQSHSRATLSLEEPMPGGRLRINPLAGWSPAEVEAYIAAFDLPRHPLVAEGYRSVGCAPCTSCVAPDEAARAGRWRGQSKTECGIHRPMAVG